MNLLIPESELKPATITDVSKLPSFFSKIRECERRLKISFGELDQAFQDVLIFRRLQQIVNTLMLNPLWKERIEHSGLTQAPENFEEWQLLPLSDKSSMNYFFMGDRPGMVVPLDYGGFEIVASGGTSSGLPSETVYSIRELHDTYKLAGDFIGKHQLAGYLQGTDPKWVMTTLADYQMWSSGTMVGGVLQNIPGINYIGAGPVMKEVFHHIMKYKGPKAIMGITQGIAILSDLGTGLSEEARKTLKVAMYGSGVLSQRKQAELRELYPDLAILSYFAATQAETIGLQLNEESPYLAGVPGLHFIEIVDSNGKWVAEGEVGELVITRLLANEAPVIRFKLGDQMVRRPALDTPALKTPQFEFSGRSGDVIHLCDTQYAAHKVYDALCRELKDRFSVDLSVLAYETQLVNQRNIRMLTLLAAVYDVPSLTYKIDYYLGNDGVRQLFMNSLMHSLSLFNQGEANVMSLEKTGYQFEIKLVSKYSHEIFRTNIGKVPFLRDIV